MVSKVLVGGGKGGEGRAAGRRGIKWSNEQRRGTSHLCRGVPRWRPKGSAAAPTAARGLRGTGMGWSQGGAEARALGAAAGT